MQRNSKSNRFFKSHFLLITMASLSSLALFSLFTLLFSLPSTAPCGGTSPSPPRPTLAIKLACNATRYRQICENSLSGQKLPSKPTAVQIILVAISVSARNLAEAQRMVREILSSSAGNRNRTMAAGNCDETLHNSQYRTESTVNTLARGTIKPLDIKDCRAWMSAALQFQYACWNGLSYANDTGLVNKTMAFLNETMATTSNALSMLVSFDAVGSNTSMWSPPRTERDGHWEKPGPSSGFKRGGVPSGLTVDAVVCRKSEKECRKLLKEEGLHSYHKTVQQAVDAAPKNGSDRFVIRIPQGTYQEIVRVPLETRNLVILGDGKGRTVITGSLSVGDGFTTYNTATLAVSGDGFMMKGVTIKNEAGSTKHQAVAFRSDSDRSVIDSCEFLGNQDTLYADTLRQFYKSCVIAGNVDFIFGNSASVFMSCEILVKPRQPPTEKGETNAVTAEGRIDPAQSTGFVFDGCLVNGTKEYMDSYYLKPGLHRSFLGRPWKLYSRTVFISCYLEALIRPEGWLPWKLDFALDTLYYGEYNNRGRGANRQGRVPWSSVIPAEHVNTYSVANFIQGDHWIPASP